MPRAIIDYPLETTRTISNMLFTGMLARLPDVRFILSHAGGAIPFLAHRLELFDTLTPFRERYPEGARHYLQRLWYDTALSASAVQMDGLRALVGPDRILFGSDFPYVPDATVVAESRDLDGYAGFDAKSRAMMERENAEVLFPRLKAG